MWQCAKCHEKIEDGFDACWNCGTSRDGTEDPNFRKVDDPFAGQSVDAPPAALAETAGESASASDDSARCPICGTAAERGCVYGADRALAGLRWYSGPPSFWANLATGLGAGEKIGSWGFGTGPYAEGVYCKHCRRIILRLG